MPTVVLEPMLEELKKIEFGAEEEMVEATASQLALKQIKINKTSKQESLQEKTEKNEGTIITVVDLPEKFGTQGSNSPDAGNRGLD